MARLNLDEQEQLNRLKYFWRDYGRYIISFLLVVIIAYGSSELWEYRIEQNTKKAAIIYDKLTQSISNNDIKSVYKLTQQLGTQYPKTEYTAFANMLAAKISFTAGDLNSTVSYLKWVVANARDKGLVTIAKLRLADVYIDQKNTKQALELMMGKTEAEFQPLFYEKRGDLYVVMNDKAKAADAYKAALDSATGNQDLIQDIQMKLEILGN